MVDEYNLILSLKSGKKRSRGHICPLCLQVNFGFWIFLWIRYFFHRKDKNSPFVDTRLISLITKCGWILPN